jgi:hypothetical protein
MSIARPSLSLLLLGACAAGDNVRDATDGLSSQEPESACSVVTDERARALEMLSRSAPACTEDADCVLLSADVSCRGASVELCAMIVHREFAAAWDESAVCDAVEERLPPSDEGCSIQASCVPPGEPTCVEGACVGRAER